MALSSTRSNSLELTDADDNVEEFRPDVDEPRVRKTSTALQSLRRQFSVFIRKSQAQTLSYEDVHANVRRNAELTQDYLGFVVFAALIATFGLADDSSVVVIASMLVSPIAGPIVGVSFGRQFSKNDKTLAKQSVYVILISVIITVSLGYFFGLALYQLSESDHVPWYKTYMPTDEMRKRATLEALFQAAFVALASGCALGLATTSNNIGSLIGVAISGSLLPPLVNTGMFLAVASLQGYNPLRDDFKESYCFLPASETQIASLFLSVLDIYNQTGLSPLVQWPYAEDTYGSPLQPSNVMLKQTGSYNDYKRCVDDYTSFTKEAFLSLLLAMENIFLIGVGASIIYRLKTLVAKAEFNETGGLGPASIWSQLAEGQGELNRKRKSDPVRASGPSLV